MDASTSLATHHDPPKLMMLVFGAVLLWIVMRCQRGGSVHFRRKLPCQYQRRNGHCKAQNIRGGARLCRADEPRHLREAVDLTTGRLLPQTLLPLQLPLNHLLPARSKPAIRVIVQPMRQQSDSPAENDPWKPEMVRGFQEIKDGEQHVRHHVNHGVPVKRQPRFHPPGRPSICDVVHAAISTCRS